MKLSSIGHIFLRSTDRSGPHQADSAPALRPPPGASADVRLWKSQLRAADEVMKDIDEALPPPGRYGEGASSSGAGPALRKHTSTRLPVASDLGAEAGQALDANLVDSRTVVMDVPGNKQSAAWAAACLRHNIRAVIDVSDTRFGEEQSCMKSNAPWAKGATVAQFMAPMAANGFPYARTLRNSELPATERQVGVRLTVQGQLVPVSNAEFRQPATWNSGADSAPLEMTWLRMPMDARQAVSPRAMLQLCRRAEKLTGPDGMCAFQSADGGRRATLLAVAHDVYRTLGTGPRSDAQRMDAITAACVRARARVSDGLLTRREDIASLLAMTRLMSEELALPGRHLVH